MRREVAIAWAEALESGDYKQNTRSLRAQDMMDDSFTYCCLGVLCDIAPIGAWRANSSTYVIGSEFCGAFPPPALSKWMGVGIFDTNVLLLDVCDGTCGPEVLHRGTAGHLNDAHYWSFAQIAHVIRQRYAADTLPPASEPDGSQHSPADTLPVESGVQ